MKKLFCLLFLLTSSCLSPTVRQGVTVTEDAGEVEDVISSMLSSDEIVVNECVDTCTNRCPVQETTVKTVTKIVYIYVETDRLPSVVRFPDVSDNADAVKMEMK